MSLENVKAFYERLGTDQAFRAQIQGVNSKDECRQIVQSAGYDFTQEELEDYTGQLLESSAAEDGLRDLDQQELEAVFGGATTGMGIKPPIFQPMYGVVFWPPKDWWPQPMYGVVIDDTI
ncbi:MAG: Nif11-like leader peptide family natural product precursor [Moorea sp. SIO3I7]|uniref:Nif11-like leader peptide family natural product n=2 Tax=Moorena TaxID=1155738 RepID=A0A1U7MWF4_9CYAN|nr:MULTISPECIES: Nif11-like leader peptide family natural product precursor [Moorena]NEO02245.1 Nif11-like leader peptide family natural product precursor [Moorena sp. SIO3I7]NEO12630.1 Nif11-like leader peptide family natural product precursor [Moorena sp. SIO3E8]NEP97659.1 Nif11-like leader peptide family natural product precursor [Moorena sp. SIO3F7]OLT58009.1 Nif11-like leader peptide family natural product precursor [Moorena bouillonii PNG]